MISHDAEFWQIFTWQRQLGRGNFAKVHEVEHNQTRERFAVKVFDKDDTDRSDLQLMVSEFKILSKLRHKNIIRLYAAYESKRRFYLVTELATGGELMTRLASSSAVVYCEDEVRRHIKTIVEAINYLHLECGVVHRDLKPENILLSDNSAEGEIKIVDMGLSRIATKATLMKTICGTHKYLAPEVVECNRGDRKGYTAAVDMWGVGMIAYIMLFGLHPFARASVIATHSAILEGNVPWPKRHNVSPEAMEFIKSLLRRTAADRPTCAQALKSPWLQYDPSSSLAEASITSEELFASEDLDVYRISSAEYMGEHVAPAPSSAATRSVQGRLREWNANRLLSKAVKSAHRRLSWTPASTVAPKA